MVDGTEFCEQCGWSISDKSSEKTNDTNTAVCINCGEHLNENLRFCLKCGAFQGRPIKRPEDDLPDPVPDFKWRYAIPSCHDYREYKRNYYWLTKKGLLDSAGKKFKVKIYIEETKKRITVKLLGAYTNDDVLEYLISHHYIYDIPVYGIANMRGNPNDGSIVFLCELENKELIVENWRSKRMGDIPVPLYGCPSVKRLRGHNLIKNVEKISYD